MLNIKQYEKIDDFIDVEGQENYVMSIKPGIAYIMENQSVKYNSKYDLVVDYFRTYTVDSHTSEFIEALYNNTLSSFKILVTCKGDSRIHDDSTGEDLSECVIDETWTRSSSGCTYYNNRYNVSFQIDNTNPKEYRAYTPMA